MPRTELSRSPSVNRDTPTLPLPAPQVPVPDFIASLPGEIRWLVQDKLQSRADRVALAQTCRDQYAAVHPQRCLEFFVTHCHQISQLGDRDIPGWAAGPLSQPLLRSQPGALTLVMLFKLHCLHERRSSIAARLNGALDQIADRDLQTAFRLFQQWTQRYSPAAGDHMPFLNADFLASAPLLARVVKFPRSDCAIETAIALTETLLTWIEHQGHQHLQSESIREPQPGVWRALVALTQELGMHSACFPEDSRVTPELLLRLTGWCHFVQESGLLHPGHKYHGGYDDYAFNDMSLPIRALQKQLDPAGETCCELADALLQWQATGLRHVPFGWPHLASLRLYGVLMDSAEAAILAGTPQGEQLLDTAMTALTIGMRRWADFADEAFWDQSAELIRAHGARSTVVAPELILQHKLLGFSHDLVSDLHDLPTAHYSQLRQLDSLIATFRELSLRLTTLPAEHQAPMAARLRTIAALWPKPADRDALASWVAEPAQ